MSPEELFLQHVPAIERIASFLCRRNRLAANDEEDFVAHVKLALIDRDYEIIRKFEGRSSFTTYLTTVIHRLLSQYLTREWGRWRPSAEAKRLGDVAVTLERLVTRDGFTYTEAKGILTTGAQPPATAAQLESIYLRLPPRQPRPVAVGDETAERTVAAETSDPDAALMEPRRRAVAAAAAHALDAALAAFDAEEQLILRLRFWQGKSVAEIAGSLHLDQKKTYKRIDRLLTKLRSALEKASISREAIADLLESGVEPAALRDAGENHAVRLSHLATGEYGDEGKVP